MIRVDRSRVPNPIPDQLRNQTHFEFEERIRNPNEFQRRDAFGPLRMRVNRLAREPLHALFENKCAFCESEVGSTSAAAIERFRPTSDASDLSGNGDPYHYSWLLADWENLHLACNACSRAKRSLFPVVNGRASPSTPLHVVREIEDALLIDPCFDDPDQHLVFTEEGLVRYLSSKGETTIKVLNLNREGLVRARRMTWERVTAAVRQKMDVAGLMAGFQPYAAVARQAVEALTDKDSLARVRNSGSVIPERRSADEILAFDEDAFRLTARALRRVEVVNFKALRNVIVEFREPVSDQAPWMMLLGENSSGKTTLLQAIALALAGAREAGRLVRPNQILSVGKDEGRVTIWFWDKDEPAFLEFKRDDDSFRGNERASAIVLGYGALRYAERKRKRTDESPPFSRVQALIEPITRVRYSGAWFADLDHTRFISAQQVLQSVLPEVGHTILERTNKRAIFNVGGHRGPLSELSAGYQTIIGVCADIMRLIFERWDTLASATGVVLIDEIDAHLHPRWAMRIVSAFREAFPQIQFIASTHNPLALRGLHNNEVALLRRDGDRIVLDQHLPPIEGMLVDDLLTSRAFGLNSTVDPATEAQLNEYYHLLSLPPNPGRNERIAELRESIGDREALGRNARERLMLQAAAQYLRDTNDSPDLRRVISPDTQNRIRDLVRLGFGGTQDP